MNTQLLKDSRKELEFDKVLFEIAGFFTNERSEELFFRKTFSSKMEILEELHAVSEYRSSFENQNTIEFFPFPTLEYEFKRMQIENFVLSAESFQAIKKLCLSFFALHSSILAFKEYYPTLTKMVQNASVEKKIVKLIDAIFTKFGEVKDSASPQLQKLRSEENLVRKKYKETFDKTLIHYRNQGLLHEIGESEIDKNRVLAVQAMYKKRVKGSVRGMSKTGSIIFIEPENVKRYVKDLQLLEEEEKKEIRIILQELTHQISEYKPTLEEYEKILMEFDRIQAKAQYAQKIDGILPIISDKKEIYLKKAYHPILYLNNKNKQEDTIPQDVELNEKNRIISISGPNAGGKSITLKTIGLLCLMIQNGILISAHPNSRMSFFAEVLTDIGDNQSIENHLSTYSSRLQKMSQILPIANENCLILIDEFGTGSDPELGGALAEAFLEYLYQKKSFCVVTTHYTNIKLKVEELAHAQNASMLFDKENLQPMYKMEVGQAGSSFTFEVAEKNHIPKELIQKAKEKLVKDKVDLDQTLVNIQQDKFELEKLKNRLEKNASLSQQKNLNISDTQDKLIAKLSDFKQLYSLDQKSMQLGKKFEELIAEYTKGESKKKVLKDFLKILEQEKFKASQNENAFSKKKERNTRKKLEKDLAQKEEKIEKKVAEKQNAKKVEFKEGK